MNSLSCSTSCLIRPGFRPAVAGLSDFRDRHSLPYASWEKALNGTIRVLGQGREFHSKLTKTFVSVTMSLDGYVAPPGMGLTDPDKTALDAWLAGWSQLQDWVFHQDFFRKNLHLPDPGETGDDNKLLHEIFNRTGTTIIGKRMFDAGERSWPEVAPFHTPVFVVTHDKREPWVRPGGTTFHFVNDGIETALQQARSVAGGRDVRIGGGGNTISQFLRDGLVEELHIVVSPVILGGGVRMFEGVDFGLLELTPLSSPHSNRVTHLRYKVGRATTSNSA